MAHIRDDCPLTEIDCKYKNIGCQNVVGNSFQFILNCRFGRKVVRLCCIFMSSCKMNYNGLSNVYTFLPFVGFKKFFLTSAPIELYCAVLEGTIKSLVAALNVINKTGIKQVFLFSLLVKKAREDAVLIRERRLFDIMASEARLVLQHLSMRAHR